MAIDHGEAWALIPWYGSDGLGAPTLADWRVWADWLQAHDPDDDRDAGIAQALNGDSALSPTFAIGACAFEMGAWLWSNEAGGFEVQPTRREMRRTLRVDTHDTTPSASGIPAWQGAWQGVSWDGVMIIDEAQRTMAVDFTAVETMRQAGMLAHNDRHSVPRRRAVSAADLLHQPRNPRRRGDTGAHGRPRR